MCRRESHHEIKLTSREVVADGEPSTHGRIHCAGRAELSLAANLLRVDPDQLREVSPDFEVGKVWVGLAEGRNGIRVDLAVEPHVCDGRSYLQVLAQGLNITARSKGGKILAIATTTGSPIHKSVSAQIVYWIRERLTGHVQTRTSEQ